MATPVAATSELTTAGSPATSTVSASLLTAAQSTLTEDTLQPIVAEAITHWAAAGADQQTLRKMQSTTFVVSSLPGEYLGLEGQSTVYLSRNAAGYGWFIDSTPDDNAEYAATATGELQAIDPRAVDRIDLLTVVEHELGHVAGLSDAGSDTADIMSPHLSPGVRRSPSPADADAVLAAGIWN